jgi:hypothetical protein
MSDEMDDDEAESAPATAGPTKPSKASLAHSTSDRVALIADMMAGGRWVLRISARQLAATWGISESRVRHISAEANRVLRQELSPDDRDAIRTKLIATLDRVILLSMHRHRYRDAVLAIQTYADFLGLRTQRVMVTEENPERFAGWSAAELRRYAETGEAPVRRSGALRALPGGKANGANGSGGNGHGGGNGSG